jgi:hypothetical protein
MWNQLIYYVLLIKVRILLNSIYCKKISGKENCGNRRGAIVNLGVCIFKFPLGGK